jgi:hypothetical protein
MIEHPSGYGHVPEPARPANDRTPLPSERVVLAAPMSFTGSAQRIWPLADRFAPACPGWRAGTLTALLYTGTLLAMIIAWAVILCWYFLWGIWLIPYRVIRRGQRKRRRDELRHREMLAAIEAQRKQP